MGGWKGFLSGRAMAAVSWGLWLIGGYMGLPSGKQPHSYGESMKITIFNGKINELNDQSVNTIGLMGTMSNHGR
jgi:hypothetical protein